MGVNEETLAIGEFTYMVRQHGYREGRALLPIVLRAIGPTLGTLLEGMGKDGKVGLEANLDLSAMLTEFSSSLSEQDLEHITTKLAERTWIVGAAKHKYVCDPNGNAHLPLVEEEHWPSRYGDWTRWLVFALRVNFSSFLAGTGSVSAALSNIAKEASESPSQNTSTGVSGESSATPG